MTDEELKSLFETLRDENAETRRHFDVAQTETRNEFVAVRQENAAAHAETRHLFEVRQAETRSELAAVRQENAAAHAETRRHFDVALEANKHEIRLVAEIVAQTREELARTTTRLDEKIERTAAETQAMIKFSHVELDRRVRTLEGTQRTLVEGLANLQARVERLESSTH